MEVGNPTSTFPLREHAVRLQNLVISAEHRYVELLPPAKRGGDRKSDEIKWPEGHLISLSKEMVYKLRKTYGGLSADQLAELKAQALETGEPLSRAKVFRVAKQQVGVGLK